MSHISAGNTTTTTLVQYGDTTGNLIFTTGGANTTALTLSNIQAATFANNVSIAGTASVTGNLSFNSGYGSSAVAYGCRAWVNFNGTGTPAIRASGNVSSLTDNGAGSYSVNFTTSMPDANYAAIVATEEGGVIATVSANNLFQQTASVGRIGVYLGTSGTGYDAEQVNYVVLR